MEWTKEQKQAIEKKGSNILVAAAAGSGKTAVLVERIINKIINEKIDIDKLLVVTFTNAAAAEMRERILNAIYKKIDEIEDESEKDNLQRQIILLNKASICTIDSFCLDVIKNNFFETNISPNFRIGDTPEMELLKQETLEELFEEKYEEQNNDFETLIKTYTSYRDDTPLKDLVLKIYTYISSSPYPAEWLENQIEKFNIQDENMDFAQTEWGQILIQEIKEELIDDIGILKCEAKRLSVEPELVLFQKTIENDSFELERVLGNLNNWDKAYTVANSIEFLTWPRNKTDLAELKENAKKVRDTVKKKLKEKIDKIFVSDSKTAIEDIKDMYQTLTKLKNLVLEFDKRFSKKKKERNILDFSDVEHLALEILVKEENGKHIRSDVAKRYQEKFEEIAIDEYQDSNLVQEYILTSVSRGNNIFMVGDVKQSIYKFRQAMPELFLDKYKKYSLENANSNGLKIQLFKNFRSRENVLDFTNLIFEKIMSEDLGDIDYTEEEYLNLGANWGNTERVINEINIIDTKYIENNDELQDEKQKNANDNEMKNAQNNDFTMNNAEQNKNQESEEIEEQERIENIELEAKFVAKKIKKLIDEKYQVYDMKKGEYRDIKYKDIVILLRSTKGKAPIFEKELINLEIPVYSDISTEYIDSIEIQTILSLLKIIDNPMQDIPLVMVLRSNIGKFTDNELVEIRLADQYSDFYTAMLKAKLSASSELKRKIENFLQDLEIWREEQEYLSLDELIWKIYEDTGFLNYVGILPNGALRQANLKMLFERAKQYETASFKGLFNFIRFIEKLRMGSGDLSSAKIIGENEDVVRIMSIHKSKGLEFPVVFLSSTGTNFNLMDLNQDILLDQTLGIGVKYINYDMQIKYDTLTKLALRNKIFVSTLSEEMRILYVALTRAKEKLIITGISKDFEKEKEDKENLLKIYKKQSKSNYMKAQMEIGKVDFDNSNIFEKEKNINQSGKINPILLKKYKTYLDWIELVYFEANEQMKNNTTLNVYKKADIVKDLKTEKQEEIDVIELIEEKSKDVTEQEIRELEKMLQFEYKFKDGINIPSKTSITAIVHKDVEEMRISAMNEQEVFEELVDEDQNNDEIEEYVEKELGETQNEIIFPLPKFLAGAEEEKITPSKRGTIVHLCMKSLDFTKEQYQLEEIKELIKSLIEKEIITQKEADSVNPYQIWQFTKSTVWKELNEAKQFHKEEPFYINIPAIDVIDNIDTDEKILAQGIIDLFYINKNDELVLLDYKTDFIKRGEEAVLIQRHKPQLMLYKEALESALDRKVDKIYIYSTCLGKEIAVK